MHDFTGQIALVTGAGRGIGREVALGFASLGASVAANDINPINLDETVSTIQQAGGVSKGYVFDIAKKMPIEGMLAQVLDDFGRVDILVNHASVRPDASLLAMDEWEFHRTLDVNLGGPYFTMQQVAKTMRELGGGSIVNLISYGEPGHFCKGHTAHTASQAGLLGLTLSAAQEFAEHHIRVNAVCHGAIPQGFLFAHGLDLPWKQPWQDAYHQVCLGAHPHLVGTVLYLCSQEAVDVTGQIIMINPKG
jgi:3-oxoacyl-[acyl-carrier protein] reductase